MSLHHDRHPAAVDPSLEFQEHVTFFVLHSSDKLKECFDRSRFLFMFDADCSDLSADNVFHGSEGCLLFGDNLRNKLYVHDHCVEHKYFLRDGKRRTYNRPCKAGYNATAPDICRTLERHLDESTNNFILTAISRDWCDAALAFDVHLHELYDMLADCPDKWLDMVMWKNGFVKEELSFRLANVFRAKHSEHAYPVASIDIESQRKATDLGLNLVVTEKRLAAALQISMRRLDVLHGELVENVFNSAACDQHAHLCEEVLRQWNAAGFGVMLSDVCVVEVPFKSVVFTSLSANNNNVSVRFNNCFLEHGVRSLDLISKLFDTFPRSQVTSAGFLNLPSHPTVPQNHTGKFLNFFRCDKSNTMFDS